MQEKEYSLTFLKVGPGKDVEQLELTCIANGVQNGTTILENYLAVSNKVSYILNHMTHQKHS